MLRRIAQCVCTSFVVASLAGCGLDSTSDDSGFASRQDELSAGNGGNLNGGNLNGGNLNGGNLNGGNLNGAQLNAALVSVDYAGATSGGAAVSNVALSGTSFTGTLGGSAISGAAFASVQLVGNLGDGSTLPLRIDSATAPSGSETLWTYAVSYYWAADAAWKPVCTDTSGNPVKAFPVANRWNYSHGTQGVGGAKIADAARFTFACEGAAIAKCTRFGYTPWTSTAMAALHQTCTRMIRADYCGDGTAHTVDGQWVNLYDAASIQSDTESWNFEADWDASGSRCFTGHSRSSTPVTCASGNYTCNSRDHFAAGALIVSEIP